MKYLSQQIIKILKKTDFNNNKKQYYFLISQIIIVLRDYDYFLTYKYDVSLINQRNAKWIYQSMLNRSPRCNVIKIQKIQNLNETKEVSFLKLNK